MADKFRRYYKIAGITIQVESDLPILDTTFSPAIREFEVEEPGSDIVVIRHHFKTTFPDSSIYQSYKTIYRKLPWEISKTDTGWIYKEIYAEDSQPNNELIAFFPFDFQFGDIYHSNGEYFTTGGLSSLTLFPTDQVFLTQLLPQRNGIFIHSAGAIINGNGILFIGHSGTGKSTTTRMLQNYNTDNFQATILCDDRNIIKKAGSVWELFGTWSHGDVPEVSSNSAELKAICFLEQADKNEIIHFSNQMDFRNLLLEHIVKSFTDTNWWLNSINVCIEVTKSINAFTMKFNKSGDIISILKSELDL